MWSYFQSIVLAFLFVFASIGSAAMLVEKPDLVPNGSADPPGDAIALRIALSPNEKDVNVEIRPYWIKNFDERANSDQQAYPLDPIPGAPANEIDQKQKAVFKFTFPRELPLGEPITIEREPVIPFEKLNIRTLGTHGLGYMVSIVKDNKVEDYFTRITKVEISELPRLKIRVVKRVLSAKLKDDKWYAVNDEGSIRTIDTKVMDAPRQAVHVQMPDQNTNIPHGFLRNNLEDRNNEHVWTEVPKREVYYATNRKLVDPPNLTPARFGTELAIDPIDHTRSLVHYGKVVVNVPVDNHDRGHLEQPGGWVWSKKDPGKHFFISKMTPYYSLSPFFDDLTRPVQFQKKDVLVFIHGYSNKLDFSLVRLAQLVHDTRFPGSPLLFSWPSLGTTTGYSHDEKVAEDIRTRKALAELLVNLIKFMKSEGSKQGRIHVAAHSMGNRVLLLALQWLAGKDPSNQIDYLAQLRKEGYLSKDEPPFHSLVFFAPDVEVHWFGRLVNISKTMAHSITQYFCRTDRALLMSEKYHGKGDIRAGAHAVFTEDHRMDTIDAERVDTSVFDIGHDYFVSKTLLLVDVELLLSNRIPAPYRPSLWKKSLEGSDNKLYNYYEVGY